MKGDEKMNLEWIKTTACPKCGETTVIKEESEPDPYYYKQMGQIKKRKERRTFACGQEITNENNKGDDASEYAICRNNDEYKEKVEKKQAAARKLLDLLESLDVDDVFKHDVKWQIEWKGGLR